MYTARNENGQNLKPGSLDLRFLLLNLISDIAVLSVFTQSVAVMMTNSLIFVSFYTNYSYSKHL